MGLTALTGRGAEAAVAGHWGRPPDSIPHPEGVVMEATHTQVFNNTPESPTIDTPPVSHWDPEPAGPVAPHDRHPPRTFTPERLAALQEEAARYAEAEQARAARPVSSDMDNEPNEGDGLAED